MELTDLTRDDFLHPHGPKHAITKQYAELLAAGANYTKDGIEARGGHRHEMNRTAQNIGGSSVHDHGPWLKK